MLLIDGQWRAGKGADMHSENPADGSRVWSGKAATADDVDAAFKAARAAFPAWGRGLYPERVAIVEAYQAYATADLGVVAYESEARDGLIVNEDVLLEIVGPDGTPLADGEVGEVVVTSFDPHHP